ncbi:DMT family transporter [Aciduricibacillus chroicocephali]|uniref:DMT family transporter n=1 Tax=Aciduricibacillus chroicocephali TaxID=3054939 RepID=A0ABY9KXC3_9BACI|nr:DMT family transporter [Bacillaceae bacterium 44XB]
MGVLFAVLSAFSFAINNVIIKKGARGSKSNNGFYITVLMNAILLGICFFIAVLIQKEPFQISWHAIPFFMLAGLCTTGLGRMTLYSSILRVGPSKASAVRNSTPVFTTLFAIIVLHEKISLIPGIGMLLLIGGVLIAGYGFVKDGNRSKTDLANTDLSKQAMIGYGLAIFSAAIFGIGQGLRKQGLNIMDDAFFGACAGAITSLIFIILLQAGKGKLRETIAGVKKDFNAYFLIAGALTSIGPLLFFLAASTLQVSYVSAIAAAEPLITTVVSAFFIKHQETITPGTWLTVLMIFSGTAIIALFAS